FFFQQSRHAYRLRWLFGAGVVVLFFLMGYFISERKQQQTTFTQLDEQSLFVGSIMESPAEKENSIVCKMQVERKYAGAQFVKMNSPALVYVAKDSASLCLKKGD